MVEAPVQAARVKMSEISRQEMEKESPEGDQVKVETERGQIIEIDPEGQVLKDEFSISHGEIDPEKASVTVPLLTKQKTLLGAISVSGHVSNFNKTNTLNFLSILKNSRFKLEKQV